MKRSWLSLYFSIALMVILLAIGIDQSVAAFSEEITTSRRCIVIDAGHGGIDGGAVSCTGVYESRLNLEIAVCLRDLLHLLGYDTKMIRTDDVSVYTNGESIAQKKVSDLKERVRIVSNTSGALLISIHQNYFSQAQYSGAQVFYSHHVDSKKLAESLQTELVLSINPGSRRKAKPGEGIYLLNNVDCTAVLVECGFLSNPKEEHLLRSADYQKRICGVIAACVARFLTNA